MKVNQRGSVLIVSLLLLLIITIVGIAGVGNSMLGEKVAANQRQISLAFMAAESGLVNAKNWFDNPINSTSWGNEAATKSGINALFSASQNAQANWNITSVVFNNKDATIRSCGEITGSGVIRCLISVYTQGSGGGELAPFVFNNLLNAAKLDVANSNQFSITGKEIGKDKDGNTIYAPAIATNSLENKDLLVKAVTDSGRINNYKGGIEVVNYDGAFGDPKLMNDFVQSIKNQWASLPNSEKGFAPTDMGTRDKPKITYHEGNLDISSNGRTGAGTLVINGNLSITGRNFDYFGLIVVTGKSFVFKGGGNKPMEASIVFASPEQDANGNWTFGGVQAEFVVDFDGGAADFIYSTDALSKAHGLLNDTAKKLWAFDAQSGAGTSGKMSGWIEDISP